MISLNSEQIEILLKYLPACSCGEVATHIAISRKGILDERRGYVEKRVQVQSCDSCRKKMPELIQWQAMPYNEVLAAIASQFLANATATTSITYENTKEETEQACLSVFESEDEDEESDTEPNSFCPY